MCCGSPKKFLGWKIFGYLLPDGTHWIFWSVGERPWGRRLLEKLVWSKNFEPPDLGPQLDLGEHSRG
jgi:hypothetical protein